MAYDGKVLRQATLRFDEDKQRSQEQPSAVGAEHLPHPRAQVRDLRRLRVEFALRLRIHPAETASAAARTARHAHPATLASGGDTGADAGQKPVQPRPETRLITVARMTAPNR